MSLNSLVFVYQAEKKNQVVKSFYEKEQKLPESVDCHEDGVLGAL